MFFLSVSRTASPQSGTVRSRRYKTQWQLSVLLTFRVVTVIYNSRYTYIQGNFTAECESHRFGSPVSDRQKWSWSSPEMHGPKAKECKCYQLISVNLEPQATQKTLYRAIKFRRFHHHHHVPEGLEVLSCSLILKMKLVPPPPPWSSRVPSSFRSIL